MRTFWAAVSIMSATFIVSAGYDATVQQQTPTVGQYSDPCHGGSKDNWGHVLWFCYNGSIDATFVIPDNVLDSAYDSWPYSADKWQGYVWYIEARSQPDYGGTTWGYAVASTDRSWGTDTYGFYTATEKQVYSNLTYADGKFTFHLNTTKGALTANYGSNCTVHQLCAFARGYDPCWQFGLCRVKPTTGNTTTTSPIAGVVVAAPVDEQAKAVQVVGKFQPIFHHPIGIDPKTNSWYKSLLMILGAGQINESCYACTLFPKSLEESMFVKPEPVPEDDVRCLLCGMTGGTKGKKQMYNNWWKTNTTGCDNCSRFNDLPLRANASHTYKKNEALTRPLMVVSEDQLSEKYPVCFIRRNNRTDNLYVGETKGCTLNITATCGQLFNITACNETGHADQIKAWNKTSYGPSDDGGLSVTQTMWLCGYNLYQILPPHWSGVCTIVYLSPTVTVHARLQYTTHHYPHYRPRSKRDTSPLMTSEGEKFMSGLFPWWGAVNNAHKLDTIHVQLENLTAITSAGFSALGPFAAAVRNTIAQHQFALDIVLASQGGLCHIIGEQCCTYIPDISGNITATILHLNDLLTQMKRADVAPSTGWSLWNWLMSGDWRGKLMELIAPMTMFIVLCCICSTCIMPLTSRMMNRMMAMHVHTYMALMQQDPTAEEAQDSEDETTI